MKDLLSRIIRKEIVKGSYYFEEIHEQKVENERLVMELNTGYHTPTEVRTSLEKITGQSIDSSVTVSLPFYTDFGKHISFGKDIFINQNVTFVDLGGVFLEDNVLIGPGARLITVNHLVDPAKRRGIIVDSIRIKENAWIGANATVLAGVTVGKNAIVAADATVTKDVPDNVIVAGTPARITKEIDFH
ncbi:DapH/DapD/GlmU-related protein [Carnobacterium sp. 17-4]|uniref:DapH/DapD/GlmU-related protein n=1 Tax=Carnobacterium sp. (strain 17-4) TaxID=208596 RepID=UPI0002D3D110|nr:DapH/DapD/GlmU-related protein [Carnobacterium sp. 17-4]